MNKLGLKILATKVFTVVASSLGLLEPAKAGPVPLQSSPEFTNLPFENFKKKKLKPKLVLRLDMNNPHKSIQGYHRSHSSHSSHSSHRSHYSSSGGGGRSSDESSGPGAGALIVGGVIAYGAYRLGKSSQSKK